MAIGYALHAWRGLEDAFLLLAGFALGIVLQRSRFCFASAFRDLFLLRDARTMYGVLTALAVGGVGYLIVFGLQLPHSDAPLGNLPAHWFVARAGWHTAIGGLAFGLGMSLAGGCFTGHLYRVGEGDTTAPVALAAGVAGFALGQLAWNPLWTSVISTAPTVWFPRWLGYGGAGLALIAFVALVAWTLKRTMPDSPDRAPWTAPLGGLLVGVIATFVFLRAGPMEVTREFGRLAWSLGLGPERLHGIDQMRGCVPDVNATRLLTGSGLFVLAIVGGSFASALYSAEFRLRRASPRRYVMAVAGGLLLGFGAMVASGCSIGAMLSGIHSFSLHGWIFAGALLAGAALGALALRLLERSSHIDVRGETCPIPALRVQKFIRAAGDRAPFTVLGDHMPSMESMRAVGARFGYRVTFERTGSDWFAKFEP